MILNGLQVKSSNLKVDFWVNDKVNEPKRIRFISQSLKSEQDLKTHEEQVNKTQEEQVRYELFSPNDSNIIIFDK